MCCSVLKTLKECELSLEKCVAVFLRKCKPPFQIHSIWQTWQNWKELTICFHNPGRSNIAPLFQLAWSCQKLRVHHVLMTFFGRELTNFAPYATSKERTWLTTFFLCLKNWLLHIIIAVTSFEMQRIFITYWRAEILPSFSQIYWTSEVKALLKPSSFSIPQRSARVRVDLRVCLQISCYINHSMWAPRERQS